VLIDRNGGGSRSRRASIQVLQLPLYNSTKIALNYINKGLFYSSILEL
jgi:hypothetical protein